MLFIFSFLIPKIFEINDDFDMISLISPSMEPTYSVGDTLLIKKINIDLLSVGDVIVFSDDNKYSIVHRVIRIDSTASVVTSVQDNVDSASSNKLCIIAKGDSNIYQNSRCVNEDNYIVKVKVVYELPFICQIFLYNNSVSNYIGAFLVIGIFSILYLDVLALIKKYRL